MTVSKAPTLNRMASETSPIRIDKITLESTDRQVNVNVCSTSGPFLAPSNTDEPRQV